MLNKIEIAEDVLNGIEYAGWYIEDYRDDSIERDLTLKNGHYKICIELTEDIDNDPWDIVNACSDIKSSIENDLILRINPHCMHNFETLKGLIDEVEPSIEALKDLNFAMQDVITERRIAFAN